MSGTCRLSHVLLLSSTVALACNGRKFEGAAGSGRTPAPTEVPRIVSSDVPRVPASDVVPSEIPKDGDSMFPKVPQPKTEIFSEIFIQEGKSGSADILIVVDDSGSMKEEQLNFSTKMNDLLLALKDSDWQIGIINTSVKSDGNGGDACDLKLVKSTDADKDEKFARAVTANLNGAANEEGIRQAVNGLKCKENPWVRSDSTVAVLILSDEDNCSKNGSDCKNHPARSEQYLIDYLEKDLKRDVGANAGFYGIFSPPANHCKTAQNDAVIYQRLVDYKAAGSTNYGNICDESYKATLEGISKNIAKLLDSKFQLKATPDDGSVVVNGRKAGGEAIGPADYSLMGASIVFRKGSEPALGSEVEVKYSVTTTLP